MPTSEQYLRSDLPALRDALIRQLDTIDGEARRVKCRREELRDTSGGYVAAPVLVALANVTIALLAQPKAVGRCNDESLPGHPGTYACTREAGHPGQHADGSNRWETYRA